MKVKFLVGLSVLLFACLFYTRQTTTQPTINAESAKTKDGALQSTESTLAAVPRTEVHSEIVVQPQLAEADHPSQATAAKAHPLSAQLCVRYTKPVCQLKDDIDLQQHLLRNDNLFINAAALVIGSSNFTDALLKLSAGKTDNEDFSTEQDIRDYLTKELSAEVYSVQLGCGIGICMASIITGLSSDLSQDLKKLQSIGSSIQAEFNHRDHVEFRLIFLAGKNVDKGMTSSSSGQPDVRP